MILPFTIPKHEAERQLYLRRLKLLTEFDRIVNEYHITELKDAGGNDTELNQRLIRQIERRYPDVMLPSDVANELQLIHDDTYE
jgi:hypothetical protein